MRILVAGAGPKELEVIGRSLAGFPGEAGLTPVADIRELGVRLKDEAPTVVLAASSLKGWDASSTVRLCMQAKPDCLCVGLARKGEENESLKLVEAGALDAFPIEQAWRLPLALARAGEIRERDAAAARMRALEALVDSVKRLSLSRRMEDIVEVVRGAARRLAQADGATFVLRDGDQCHYVDEDAIGPLWRGKRFPMGESITGWCMLNKRPAIVPDIFSDARVPVDAYRPTFVKSLVVVPIRAANPIGAIGVYWARKRQAGEDEVALLQMLADSAALALENVQAYADLERRVRERTASLEAVNKELEAFARSVSHDLRSPLAVIVGYSDMLADEVRVDLPAGDRSKVLDIRAAAMRMNVLIDDMLRLSQVIKREVESRRVDLTALSEGILADLTAAHPDRRVEAMVESGLWAMGDPGLLRIALENLLSNAWKYTSNRDVGHIRVGRAQPGGSGVAFYVEDDGSGFDMQAAGRLFKPFQRLHSLSEYPGTGVGLATVSRVMEKHGGSVWVESEQGKGATFFFELPAEAGMVPEPGILEDAAQRDP